MIARRRIVGAWIAACAVLVTGVVPAGAVEAAAGFVQVSPRDPRYFELSDGRPFIPIGLNVVGVWSARDTAGGLAQMERWMKALSDHGGNFLRVWLSSSFWDVEHEQCGAYNPEVAKRIDGLFALARKYGIRLKLTIEHFREIDPDSGYKRAWALKSLHHLSRGGTARSMTDWFEGDPSRTQFEKKLDWYAARYGDDPIVFGWELWNEINATRGAGYMAWTRHMLRELDRRFPRNLCMQSLGSFDHDRWRDPYRELCLMPENDVAQVHRYLDLGARLPVCHGPVDVLAADAVTELVALEPGKPVLLAESGAVEPGHAGPFEFYGRDKIGIILHDVIFAPFFAGAAGTGQCWHWDVYVDANNLWWHFGRFAAAVDGLDPPAESFQPLVVDHPRLRVYLLRGKRTVLVWCRDKENTWKTELAEEAPPEILSGAVIDLGGVCGAHDVAVRAYDPWSNRWTDGNMQGGRIHLPTFSRSMVVRFGIDR